MTPYTWSCIACSEINAPTAYSCVRCGCPAQTNYTQVRLARTALRNRTGLDPFPAPDVKALLAQVPWLPIAAALFLLVGAAMLIVNAAPGASAFGVLMLALAALCVSSYRAPAKT